jgi:hypothetical protein
VRLPDDAVVVDASGRTVSLDARDVAVTDMRAGGDTVPATVTVALTWKGGGGRRRVTTSSPGSFDGRIFRASRARGTFAASEDGFTFAPATPKPVRALFAEVGAERNGSLVAALATCPRCAPPGTTAAGVSTGP